MPNDKNKWFADKCSCAQNDAYRLIPLEGSERDPGRRDGRYVHRESLCDAPIPSMWALADRFQEDRGMEFVSVHPFNPYETLRAEAHPFGQMDEQRQGSIR